MADEGDVQMEQQSNAGKWILIVLAILVVAAFGYAQYVTHSDVEKSDRRPKREPGPSQRVAEPYADRGSAGRNAGREAGMTKKELAQRTAELQAEQKAAVSRLENEQKAQINAVTGEISGVKTDVGGVQTDVASTKADLEATKAKLQSTIGDLGVQSGLIAHTQGDLEVLKHKGDRNYYEFTLLKGAKPQPVSTVSLQLKKADVKKGKFTMNVTADDKTIEKKDRNVAEPIQFYSGRDHLLFELVVWTVDKNKATGYLSTPKNAPVPVTAN